MLSTCSNPTAQKIQPIGLAGRRCASTAPRHGKTNPNVTRPAMSAPTLGELPAIESTNAVAANPLVKPHTDQASGPTARRRQLARLRWCSRDADIGTHLPLDSLTSCTVRAPESWDRCHEEAESGVEPAHKAFSVLIIQGRVRSTKITAPQETAQLACAAALQDGPEVLGEVTDLQTQQIAPAQTRLGPDQHQRPPPRGPMQSSARDLLDDVDRLAPLVDRRQVGPLHALCKMSPSRVAVTPFCPARQVCRVRFLALTVPGLVPARCSGDRSTLDDGGVGLAQLQVTERGLQRGVVVGLVAPQRVDLGRPVGQPNGSRRRRRT